MTDVDLNAINQAATPVAPVAPVAATAPPVAPPAGDPPPAGTEVKPFYSSLPDDWRAQVVKASGVKDGETEKLIKHLERYADLPNALKAGYEAANKIRQGLVSNGLPDKPTPEELTTYREAHGIPPEPAKYELQLSEGLALSEADSQIMQEVYKAAHGHNIPAKVLSDITSSFLAARGQLEGQIEQNDVRDEQEGRAALKEVWGRDYEPNLNAANNFLNRLPQGVIDQVLEARTPDGGLLRNQMEFIAFIADAERKINPQATIVQNSQGAMTSRDSRIKELEGKMRDRDAWFKDAAAQEELQSLYANKQKYG